MRNEENKKAKLLVILISDQPGCKVAEYDNQFAPLENRIQSSVNLRVPLSSIEHMHDAELTGS